MKKNLLVVAVMVLVIGAVLFQEPLLALLHGMTPLESLKFIFNFVLHVVVVTIAGYIAYTLPEIVTPFLRMFKRNRRSTRRNRSQVKPVNTRQPKLTTDMLLREYVLKQALPKTGRGAAQPAPTQQENIRLDF